MPDDQSPKDGQEVKPKRRRGRPKKSEQSTLNKEPSSPQKELTKTEKAGLKLINEQTRQAQVLRYLIAGYSKEEIVEELQIGPRTLTNIISQIKPKITKEVAQLRDSWSSLTLARTEIIMKKLMFDMSKPDYKPDKGDIDMFSKLVNLQLKVMGGDDRTPSQVTNNFFSPQLDSNSLAYKYSMANQQHRVTGETMDGLEDFVVQDGSPESKLDGILD